MNSELFFEFLEEAAKSRGNKIYGHCRMNFSKNCSLIVGRTISRHLMRYKDELICPQIRNPTNQCIFQLHVHSILSYDSRSTVNDSSPRGRVESVHTKNQDPSHVLEASWRLPELPGALYTSCERRRHAILRD